LKAGESQAQFIRLYIVPDLGHIPLVKLAPADVQAWLDKRVAAALRAHRTRQLEERLAAGEACKDLDLVFCTRTGSHIAGSNLRKAHILRLKRLGLPYIRIHDMRHTAATLALLQGVPAKVVSEMLGHASITITMNLYMHVLPSMQDAAAEAMEALLLRRG
jgi:integrase